jgi:hypothetical protein
MKYLTYITFAIVATFVAAFALWQITGWLHVILQVLSHSTA